MGPKVLIVEDQGSVSQQIKDFLEWIGCRVVGNVSSGKDVLDAYEELEPDLVTMDLMMPEMNGVEATRSLIDKHKNAKILIFTSLDVGENGGKEDEMVKESLEAGAMEAVCKFSKDGILKVMKRMYPNDLDL